MNWTIKSNVDKLLCTALVFFYSPLSAAPLPCIIEPTEKVELGSAVIGILETISVERGDSVKKGQVIAKLAADVERKSVDLASLRINDFSAVQSAVAAKEHAKREKIRAVLLFKKSLISKQSLDKAVTEATLAQHQLSQARENVAQSEQELKLAKAKLNQRILRSPISGIITERYLSPGNRIQDEPIVQIVKIDPLRVEVIAPAEYFNTIKKGEKIEVSPDLPGYEPKLATVKIVDRILDAASNTFRITLELKNKDHTIPAGARCTIDLDLAGAYEE